MTYSELARDLELLVTNNEWAMVRSWFGYWADAEEQIDKAILWGRFFLPHYFRDSTPPFHRELIRENFSDKNEYTAAPRGFSKTTLNQLCISFQIANKLESFIVVIEKNFTEAAEVLSAVRNEFENNEMIIQVYGKMVKRSETGKFDDKNKDAEGDLFINGVRLRAKGFNAPIRGLKSNEWRPTKIYVDDVEEDTHIQNEEQRKKYRDNYTQGIVPSVDIIGNIKVRGTILHFDSLLKNLIDQHQGKIYRAFPPEKHDEFLNGTLASTDLLWPERWTHGALMKKKEEMELAGKGTSKFWQEFLNEPTDEESRTFRQEWMQNRFTDEDLKMRTICRTATIDAADSMKQGADFTGVTVNDWDSENNWFIQYAKRHKVNITGLVDLVFWVWTYFKPIKIGIEKKALEDQVLPLLKLKSEETGIYPVVVELDHGGKRKEDRIRGSLVGRFENGKVWFKKDSKDDQGLLRSELYDFPNSKNDDLGDALAYHEQIGNRPLGKPKEEKQSIEKDFWEHKRATNQSLAARVRNL